MTATLTDEVIVFADERVKRLRRTESGLYGSALYALRHFKEGTNWYGALLSRAATLMRNDYRKVTGDKGTPQALRNAVDDFLAEAELFLNKTQQPKPETITNGARIIAQSLATAATNAAAEAAGKEMDTISMKTWVSMEDEKVRPTHAAANGQTVPVGEKFDVGGHAMRKPGDLTAPPEEVINCRCIVALSASEALTAATLEPHTDTQGVEMADDETQDAGGEEQPPERPENPIESPDTAIPFWGVAAPEDKESGDGRMFAESSLRSRPLPLPLATQKVNEPGHDGSVKTGNIERLWRRSDGMIYYSGHFLTTEPMADELVGMMAESGGRTGISIDADDGSMSMQTRDGRSIEEVMQQMDDDPEMEAPDDIITVFDSARICGATTCNIPAFHEAFIELGEVPEEFSDGEDLLVESQAEQMGRSEEDPPEETLAAAGPVKTEDGPGWLTHPVDTDRLRDYWVHGAGAAKIDWGVPGDFNRCRTFLAEYIKPQHLSGYCANRHYDALGFWPGHPTSGETIAASGAPEGSTMAPSITLVADAPKGYEPPREWFDDPEFEEVTPLTITEDGRVFGHVAAWGTCHIGFPDSCTEPPRSPSNYAYFRTGATLCANGEQVPTGNLTVGTGHVNLRANAQTAMAHYDNTGAAAANVAAGEDEFGIWVSGAVNPFASEKAIYELRSGSLSGDWRRIAGELEMVAALGVNVPGFPIPRTAMAASAGMPESLVASGVVPPREETFTHDDIEAAVEAVLARREAKQRMEELRASVGLDPKSRMAALAAASN